MKLQLQAKYEDIKLTNQYENYTHQTSKSYITLTPAAVHTLTASWTPGRQGS